MRSPVGAAWSAELSDMAWTACAARSHFDFRAGVVFRDAQSLRDGLRSVADASDSPQGCAARLSPQGGLRLHGTGQSVGGHGRVPLLERTGVPRGARPLRPACSARAGRVPAGRDVRAARRGGRTGRPVVDSAGHLCPGVRPRRPLGQRGNQARRGSGPQPGGDSGGVCSRGLLAGGWPALRVGSRQIDGEPAEARRHGRSLRAEARRLRRRWRSGTRRTPARTSA